jgi:hypothetical protein
MMKPKPTEFELTPDMINLVRFLASKKEEPVKEKKTKKKTKNSWRVKKLDVLSKEYSVVYSQKAQDLDVAGMEAIWGTVDPFRKIIRVYDSEHCPVDTLDALMHEILHAISIELNMELLIGDQGEKIIGPLATALVDVLVRNKIIEM